MWFRTDGDMRRDGGGSPPLMPPQAQFEDRSAFGVPWIAMPLLWLAFIGGPVYLVFQLVDL